MQPWDLEDMEGSLEVMESEDKEEETLRRCRLGGGYLHGAGAENLVRPANDRH